MAEAVYTKSLKGKKNIYMCHTCGHGFVSQDVDDGVTPFSTRCRHIGCEGIAMSFMYMAPQEMLAEIRPAIEWYRPSLDGISPSLQAHVDQGGLIPRPRQSPIAEGDSPSAVSEGVNS